MRPQARLVARKKAKMVKHKYLNLTMRLKRGCAKADWKYRNRVGQIFQKGTFNIILLDYMHVMRVICLYCLCKVCKCACVCPCMKSLNCSYKETRARSICHSGEHVHHLCICNAIRRG